MIKIAESNNLIDLSFKRDLLRQNGVQCVMMYCGKIIEDFKRIRGGPVHFRSNIPGELFVAQRDVEIAKAILLDAQVAFQQTSNEVVSEEKNNSLTLLDRRVAKKIFIIILLIFALLIILPILADLSRVSYIIW